MNTKRHYMNPLAASPRNHGFRNQATRGSVLLTALIFAFVIGISITSYLQMSATSLKLAHRSFFADAACNLAEAGTEEAVWSFNKLGYATDSTSIHNAWSGWTLGQTVAGVNVSSMGSGYSTSSPPSVTFTNATGDTTGSGAAGTAIVTTVTLTSNNTTTTITGVTGVTITNPGSGYTLPPTISFGGSGGAAAQAMLSATRTFTFNNLGQNATGSVKVWVDGYDGNATVPIVVSQATITPYDGPPITKMIKIIIGKNGVLPKGLIAKDGITWNGHPLADSYVSGTPPGIPPFSQYTLGAAQGNITVGSLAGTIDLGSGGVVNGNIDLGPGVTVTGGTVTGQTLSGMTGTISLPTYPANSGATAGVDLGSSLPAILPRVADTTPAADGNYYYYVHGATIGATTITAGKKVVIVGDTNTSMAGGFQIGVTNPSSSPPVAAAVGSATIYMDGPVNVAGGSSINTSSWAGALAVYTSTTTACTFGGNSFFCGILTAPNAALVGNGGGNDGMDLCGSFVVNSVTSNGHMNFHYDQNLASINPSSKAWSLGLWREMQSASDRALYASQLNF